MKFLLFRILFLSRTKDRGFTLPMVIGFGLIMVLLSSISLLQSSEENLTSISKTQSSTSLAMAELGIARYRELLDNNRFLAVNNLDNWVAEAGQVCDENDIAGWADNSDATGWRPIEFDETDIPIDFNNDGDTTDANAEIGSYRIIDYIYQNDANPGVNGDFGQISDDLNTGNPRGILTVQGRDSSDNSVSQIQVTIPLGVNTNDLESLDPGIWIHQGNEGGINFGTLDFSSGNGNLVLNKNANGCDDVNITAGPNAITAIRDPRDLPPLAELPPDPADYNNLSGDISTDGDFVANELILGKLSATSNLDGDGVERYYYKVTGDLDIAAGESLLSDGTAKVIIIVDGDLNIDSDTTSETKVTNSSDAATSSYLEIHVKGDVNISGSGQVNIKALIHANGDNDGTVNITGSPTVNLTGSIWAKDWDSVGIVNVTSSDYQFYSITPGRTPKPLTYAATEWEQQEAE